MGRARCYKVFTDVSGNALVGASVNVYDPNTTTPIAETMYQDYTGSDTLSNPLTTGTDGSIRFYLDNPKRVDLLATKTGYQNTTLQDVMVDPDAGVWDTSTGHDHDGTDSKKVASSNLSDAPASCSALFNRSAASEYIQRGQASNADTVGSDTPYYLGNGFAVTFAVAFTGTPKVFLSYNGSIAGGNAIIASLSAAPSTTGFTYLISGSKSGTFTPPVDWLAIGA